MYSLINANIGRIVQAFRTERQADLVVYNAIMRDLRIVNVAQNADYQRRYKGFWRVRCGARYCNAYFALLQREKDNGVLDPCAVAKKLHVYPTMAVLLGGDGAQEPRADHAQPERLLNQIELAQMLNVHPTTVRRWRLPCHRLGRVPRYRMDEVMEYVASPAFRRRLKELKKMRDG